MMEVMMDEKMDGDLVYEKVGQKVKSRVEK